MSVLKLIWGCKVPKLLHYSMVQMDKKQLKPNTTDSYILKYYGNL